MARRDCDGVDGVDGVNYYERHIGDYLKDTAHLSLLEHGVYTRLLDVYYTKESGVEESEVARLVGAKSKDERAALAVVLREFFTLADGKWTQGRCDREIARFRDKQRKAAASAQARWGKQPELAERNANAMRTHSEGNAHQTPDTRHQKPEEIQAAVPPARKRAPAPICAADLAAEGVDAQHAADWLAVRKAKHLPLTPTAWADTKAEAAKAGVGVAEAVRMAAAHGWGGFRASWLQGKDAPLGGSVRPINRQLAVEAENRRVAAEWLAQEAARDGAAATRHDTEARIGTA